MSFRVYSGIVKDAIKTRSMQTIPVQQTSTPYAATTPGTIAFEQSTNTFYGRGNQANMPLSTRVVTSYNTGITPTGIAITNDGKKAYVANNNNYGITGQDSVTVLDLTTQLPLTTINDVSFSQPYTITMSPDGTKYNRNRHRYRYRRRRHHRL